MKVLYLLLSFVLIYTFQWKTVNAEVPNEIYIKQSGKYSIDIDGKWIYIYNKTFFATIGVPLSECRYNVSSNTVLCENVSTYYHYRIKYNLKNGGGSCDLDESNLINKKYFINVKIPENLGEIGYLTSYLGKHKYNKKDNELAFYTGSFMTNCIFTKEIDTFEIYKV